MDDVVIVGESGASGKGWSELKDIECTYRYAKIKEAEAKWLKAKAADPLLPRVPTAYDEAFQCGIFLHAARAKWLELGQGIEKNILEQCWRAGHDDCLKQEFNIPELSVAEYSLMFTNYANYWAVRPKPKPYAVELFMEYDFGSVPTLRDPLAKDMLRTTRLDDVSYYPDVGGYCIGEFKSTYTLSGSLKYYTGWNPQILLQQLIYLKCFDNKKEALNDPPIKGTMADIWDKGKQRGTRHYIPLDLKLLKKYEIWVCDKLRQRKLLLDREQLPERNFLVCNTFNDAYNSQCAWKERCLNDGD